MKYPEWRPFCVELISISLESSSFVQWAYERLRIHSANLKAGSVECVQQTLREGGFAGAGGEEPALVEYGHFVAEPEDMVGVMATNHGGDAGLGDAAQGLPDEHLVAEIKGRGGFIKEHQGRALGDGPSEIGELALTAGEGRAGFVGKMVDAGGMHGLMDDFLVVRGKSGESKGAEVRCSAHGHNFADKEGKAGFVFLRNIGHLAGAFVDGKLRRIESFDQDGALLW